MDHSLFLILAVALDAVLGDPAWMPHPIRLIGKAIDYGETWLRQTTAPPMSEFRRGAVLVVLVVGGAYVLTRLLLFLLMSWSWWIGMIATLVLGSLCLARRSLKEHAQAVLDPLRAGDIRNARSMLARMVSRETSTLSEPEIIRGAVESVAENSSDGIIAPLFYLAIGGVPLAMTYKAINTLDSMIGYHTERYEQFGKVAARLDDVANYIPARLSALALISAAWVGRHTMDICTMKKPRGVSPGVMDVNMRAQMPAIPKLPWLGLSECNLADHLATLASWSKNPHWVMHISCSIGNIFLTVHSYSIWQVP